MKSGPGYVVTTVGNLVAQAIDATKETSDSYTNDEQVCRTASLVVSRVLAENGHEVLLRRLAALGLDAGPSMMVPQLRRGPRRMQPPAKVGGETHGNGNQPESAGVAHAYIAS
jgi:hypothetical protein